jgi:YaiO family outer membrane protein
VIVAPEPAAIIQTDIQSLYRSAVADRLAGRPADAVPKLEQVLVARPEDVDARLNLGLALLALGRLDDAEAAFRRVVAQAPDYADAWIGLARVEQRRGDLAAARTLANEARRAAPDSAEVVALQQDLKPEPEWRADIFTARSQLSGDLPDWTETHLSLSRRLDTTWTVGGAIEATRRFGLEDIYFGARVDAAVKGGSAYVAVGGAPDADYRPEIAVAAGGWIDLAAGIAATVDASVARYPRGVVSNLHPGLAGHLAGGRVQLSARWINVWDENGDYRTGYSAQTRWEASDRLALRLGYADAPETTNGFTVDVVTWNVGADVGLTDRVTLRIGYLSEDRDAYDREEVSLGIGWRF